MWTAPLSTLFAEEVDLPTPADVCWPPIVLDMTRWHCSIVIGMIMDVLETVSQAWSLFRCDFTIEVCNIPAYDNCFWCDGPACKSGDWINLANVSMFNGGKDIIFKQFAHLPNVPIFFNHYDPAKGCATDANCPLDRPVCGAGLLIDASGSGSGGVKF